MASTHQRWRILYSGHVQGVGFRWTVKHIAQSHAVAGFVKNLDDGRVELVAEGEGEELEHFLAVVLERFRDQVRDQAASTSPATGEFRTFEIVH